MTAPLPCPRCGAPAKISNDGLLPAIGRRFDWMAICSAGPCAEDLAIIGYGPTRDAVIADWNMLADTEIHEIADELHPIERDLLLQRYDGPGGGVPQVIGILCENGLIHELPSYIEGGQWQACIRRTELGERVAAILRESEQGKVKA